MTLIDGTVWQYDYTVTLSLRYCTRMTVLVLPCLLLKKQQFLLVSSKEKILEVGRRFERLCVPNGKMLLHPELTKQVTLLLKVRNH